MPELNGRGQTQIAIEAIATIYGALPFAHKQIVFEHLDPAPDVTCDQVHPYDIRSPGGIEPLARELAVQGAVGSERFTEVIACLTESDLIPDDLDPEQATLEVIGVACECYARQTWGWEHPLEVPEVKAA